MPSSATPAPPAVRGGDEPTPSGGGSRKGRMGARLAGGRRVTRGGFGGSVFGPAGAAFSALLGASFFTFSAFFTGFGAGVFTTTGFGAGGRGGSGALGFGAGGFFTGRRIEMVNSGFGRGASGGRRKRARRIAARTTWSAIETATAAVPVTPRGRRTRKTCRRPGPEASDPGRRRIRSTTRRCPRRVPPGGRDSVRITPRSRFAARRRRSASRSKRCRFGRRKRPKSLCCRVPTIVRDSTPGGEPPPWAFPSARRALPPNRTPTAPSPGLCPVG